VAGDNNVDRFSIPVARRETWEYRICDRIAKKILKQDPPACLFLDVSPAGE